MFGALLGPERTPAPPSLSGFGAMVLSSAPDQLGRHTADGQRASARCRSVWCDCVVGSRVVV